MRTKKNSKYRYGVINYDSLIAECDFHSHNAPICPEEISKEIEDVIDYEYKNKNRILRIIVGKGNNSEFGPVIKPIVKQKLLNLARNNKIKKFNLEKMKSGKINSGAFIVEIY